jgi:hypothetical protein
MDPLNHKLGIQFTPSQNRGFCAVVVSAKLASKTTGKKIGKELFKPVDFRTERIMLDLRTE